MSESDDERMERLERERNEWREAAWDCVETVAELRRQVEQILGDVDRLGRQLTDEGNRESARRSYPTGKALRWAGEKVRALALKYRRGRTG